MTHLIQHWSVCFGPHTPYDPPEMWTQHLQGVVDDKHIVTSPIKGRRGHLVITASGSEYALGAIDLHYESLYPRAQDRLMNSLPEVP